MNKSNVCYRNPKILEELYWRRNLSALQIARMFGVKSHTTILNYLQKFNIPRKPSDRRNYWRTHFFGNLNEKAYLLGLRTGDLHAFKHFRLIKVETTSPRNAQLKMFKEAFEKYAPVIVREAKGGYTEKTNRMYCFLNSSFNFLVDKPKTIPDWILDDNELFYAFLAGYCDCEASWIITQHKKYDGKYKDLIFSLGTCDKAILEQIHQKLKELGFNVHLYMVREKGTYGDRVCNFDLYRVMISDRKSVVKLAEKLLPLSKHDEKIAAKLRIINYEKMNQKRKLLKRQKLGTVELTCIHCGHKKVWRNGFSRHKDKRYPRYQCPICKKEFSRKEE